LPPLASTETCATYLLADDGRYEKVPGVAGRASKTEPCRACGASVFWLSIYGSLVCACCHPPAASELVAKWITIDAIGDRPSERSPRGIDG
jgi:hypothetical protein